MRKTEKRKSAIQRTETSSRKKILLAAALGLCLLLTGCYIAPDDVNTNQTGSTGSALPFVTLAPTATVVTTPDTVVVETQNVFNGQGISQTTGSQVQTTPAPSGGSGGWNDWGTVQQTDGSGVTPTPMPTGATIVFDNSTAAPDEQQTGGITVITPSPSPEGTPV